MIERYWNAAAIAQIIGAIFIVVGLLGFIPNPLVSSTGYFHVNAGHNLVHLVTGAVLVASAYYGVAVATIRVVAVVYALVALVGFMAPNAIQLDGMIAMNMADHWLHAIGAVVLLLIAFTRPLEEGVTTARM